MMASGARLGSHWAMRLKINRSSRGGRIKLQGSGDCAPRRKKRLWRRKRLGGGTGQRGFLGSRPTALPPPMWLICSLLVFSKFASFWPKSAGTDPSVCLVSAVDLFSGAHRLPKRQQIDLSKSMFYLLQRDRNFPPTARSERLEGSVRSQRLTTLVWPSHPRE
jgi:hypothetical protein